VNGFHFSFEFPTLELNQFLLKEKQNCHFPLLLFLKGPFGTNPPELAQLDWFKKSLLASSVSQDLLFFWNILKKWNYIFRPISISVWMEISSCQLLPVLDLSEARENRSLKKPPAFGICTHSFHKIHPLPKITSSWLKMVSSSSLLKPKSIFAHYCKWGTSPVDLTMRVESGRIGYKRF